MPFPKGYKPTPETVEKIRVATTAAWARRKAAKAKAKLSQQTPVPDPTSSAPAPVATLQLREPKRLAPVPNLPARTVIHHIADASNELVSILRIPMDQLRIQLTDPIIKTLVKREALNLSNRAEEFLSLIAHIERLEKIQKIRE
jgi:hypothetical protein